MILQKLSEARAIIKSLEIKKAGRNEFSKYDYFTPEQINHMVYEAEKETGLIHLFNLEKKDGDVYGTLLIYEIETGECQAFTQLTAIPDIKATNISQQIGGAVTYTNRYMLMTAFDISDNSLDFDAKDNREEKIKPTAKPENMPEKAKFAIPEKAFNQLCEKLKANPDPLDRGNLLAKTRRYYLPLTDDQENIIKQITDN